MAIETPELTEKELKDAAFQAALGATNATVFFDKLSAASNDDLLKLFTVAQFIGDVCLNECERRGLIEVSDDGPVIPYCSEHAVETILTRE